MPCEGNRVANHHIAVCKSSDGLSTLLVSVPVLPGASHRDHVRGRLRVRERSHTLGVPFQHASATALHSPRPQLGRLSVAGFRVSFSIDSISKIKITP
jgi:hypothetical protein